MTATESVRTNNTVIGAKKVSGLFLSGCVTNVMTATTRTIYTEAPSALANGVLSIEAIVAGLIWQKKNIVSVIGVITI